MNHTIFCQDALNLHPDELPDNCVMITDPPYSEHVHARVAHNGEYGSRPQRRDLGFAHLSDELRIHLAAVGAKCRWSVVFCDWEGLHAWRQAFDARPGYRYIRAIPWVRWSMPQLSGDRPPQGSECVLIAGREGALQWNGPGNLTHFDEKCERGAGKHTAAKPLDLMMRIVQYFSNPGECVIDLTCGRGTTMLATALLGERESLGFEANPVEAELAQARLVNPLSERDQERVDRYAVFRRAEIDQMAATRAATNKIREKKGLGPK